MAKKILVPRWVIVAVACLAVVSVATLIMQLGAQNRLLKTELASLLGTASGSPSRGVFATGTPLPAVDLESLDGALDELDAVAGPSGVMVFLTTTCQYCIRTLPVWTELESQLAERGNQFVAISLHPREQTLAFKKAWGVDWPIWVLPPQSAQSLNVSAVPLTVAYSAGQGILQVWGGALRADQILEILATVADADR